MDDWQLSPSLIHFHFGKKEKGKLKERALKPRH